MTKERTIWDSRKALWNGIGTEIKKALSAEEALEMAELDWNVIQKDLFTEDGEKIEGFKANVKETDGTVLGIVSDKYVVVQNKDALHYQLQCMHYLSVSNLERWYVAVLILGKGFVVHTI